MIDRFAFEISATVPKKKQDTTRVKPVPLLMGGDPFSNQLHVALDDKMLTQRNRKSDFWLK